MDVRQVGRLGGDLDRYLRLFDDCFARSEGRELLRRYVRGQLSDVRRKCVEPMADAMYLADEADTQTLPQTLTMAQANLLMAGSDVEIKDVPADKGYHSNETLTWCHTLMDKFLRAC